MSLKSAIHIPTAEEDAAITAAARADPDTPPLTDEELAQFKRTQPRNQSRSMTNTEIINTTLRLDRRVLEAYMATGAEWQERINEALMDWAQAHGMMPREP